MYKFVTTEEYEERYLKSHPSAIKFPDSNTVVLSMNKPCSGCVSHREALKYINENLRKE